MKIASFDTTGYMLIYLIELNSFLLLSFLVFPNFVRIPNLKGVNERDSGLVGAQLDLCSLDWRLPR